MKTEHLSKLLNWFEGKNSVLVALSGGVDSALVAYSAYAKLGKSAIAVTADYKTLAQEELEHAKKTSAEIGIKHIVIEYNELVNESFVKNDNNRCFYCRSELSEHLLQVAKEFETDMIVDGTNIDDLGDYRPGVSALHQNGIRSPLAETRFSKKMVRETAKNVGLSVYDKPSNSCLASRIPWGQSVTAERLARIEIGEKIVKQLTGAKQVRVRDMNGTAKIEVGVDELPLLKNNTVLQKIKNQLKLISFEDVSIDPEGYRPGKINVITN
uniref:ExsB family protein n=1 Tax=uncultured marine thaumarchaeote KM3_61_H06 TaxID=1456215 RepID=A0A075HHJ3_9ARCH|nr:ExsB family protein [uncultured marine thaumarchaeote KM3_61_H06]